MLLFQQFRPKFRPSCQSQLRGPPARYLPLTTSSLVARNQTANRVESVGSDATGRRCCHILEGTTGGPKFVLWVSIYQWCRRRGTDTGMSAHTQQQWMLSGTDRSSLDPRTNFVAGLQAFPKSHTAAPDGKRNSIDSRRLERRMLRHLHFPETLLLARPRRLVEKIRNPAQSFSPRFGWC